MPVRFVVIVLKAELGRYIFVKAKQNFYVIDCHAT